MVSFDFTLNFAGVLFPVLANYLIWKRLCPSTEVVSEISCSSPLFPQVNQFRQLYSKVINDKHDDVMAKFGAILAQGILDAGQYQNVDKCNTKKLSLNELYF